MIQLEQNRKPTVLQIISGRAIGGAEKIVIGLAKGLREKGYPVVVACPPKSWTAGQLIEAGFPVETFPMKGIGAKMIGHRRLRQILKRYRIGLVHSHMRLDSELTLPEAASAGIPTVCTMHMYGEELYCRMADATVAITEVVKADLVQRGMPDESVTVVMNGIPVEEFSCVKTDFRASHGFLESDIVVGAVSRFIHRKGIDVLIQAVSECPGVKLVLAGYGRSKYEQYLRTLARECGVLDRTIFVGPVDDPAPLISALDVYALPSREEGLGITILEAMASGVPVVASAVGGVPEVITDGATGLLVPPDQPERLAEAITRLATDKKLASQISANARGLVTEHFKVSDMTDNVERVYQRVLKGTT